MTQGPLPFQVRTFASVRPPNRSALRRVSAALSWKASAEKGAGQVLPTIGTPQTGSRAEATLGNTETNWLCVFCHKPIASEKDRFPYNGKDEFTFVNPAGITFEIITFSEARGCHESGKPTLAATWFPGYGWSFCHCDGCGQQLGWYYTGPLRFVGLDKARIIRAFVNN
jgi:hypothetical protein